MAVSAGRQSPARAEVPEGGRRVAGGGYHTEGRASAVPPPVRLPGLALTARCSSSRASSPFLVHGKPELPQPICHRLLRGAEVLRLE